MRINHNIPALYAYNSVNSTNNAMQKSIQKLSSGLRINSAADDAAGLTISEKMRAQITGMDQAIGNSQDGINMIQTAEGALNETTSILQRMRELSVQAANDTLTANDRQAVQDEVDQLTEEIDRISNTTQFNKKKLLNGDAAALTSTDNLKTKVSVRGGLREIDQFGQKKAAEGNYKISIDVDEIGKAQVQKTDIFKVKHDTGTVSDKSLGWAEVGGTYTVGIDTDELALHFNIDGEDVDLASFEVSTGTVDAVVSNLNANIALNSDLSGKIQAATEGGALVLRRVDDPGKSFTVWQEGDGNVSIAGIALTSATATEVDATEDNIIGLENINAKDWLTGNYAIDTVALSVAAAAVVTPSVYAQGAGVTDLLGAGGAVADSDAGNFSLALEITGINGSDITVNYKGFSMAKDGTINTWEGSANLSAGVDNGATLFGGTTSTDGIAFSALELTAAGNFTIGDKIVVNSQIAGVDTDDQVKFKTYTDDGVADAVMGFTLNNNVADNSSNDPKTFTFFQLDDVAGSDTYGKLVTSEATLTFEAGGLKTDTLSTNPTEAKDGKFAAAQFVVDSGNTIGDIASGESKAYDVEKFWDSNGNFMIEDPQTITMVQGDGEKTSITIYKDDTMDDIASKLNDAIRDGLGQGELEGVSSDATNFVEYVGPGEFADVEETPYSVEGTFVISSAINGSDGEITFVGDEEFVNALSLNQIQASQENRFSVTVTDAHSGEEVAKDVKITGNNLVGVVHNNVDVEFDTMADVSTTWDNANKEWTTSNASDSYTTTVHLADNTTVFQIGANEKEDMGINIGDMSASALGVDNIQVTDRENAAHSITVIDDAIERVSSQRSGLGAYQNRLEHTINNLTTGSTNITAAESRIRDVDMASEMMKYTSLSVLMQAGNSMLGQAKSLPQNVLSLLQ